MSGETQSAVLFFANKEAGSASAIVRINPPPSGIRDKGWMALKTFCSLPAALPPIAGKTSYSGVSMMATVAMAMFLP